MKIRFQEVKARTVITLQCKAGCGRRLRRVVAEAFTVNPFNRDADGVPKTFAEVQSDVREAVAQRVADLRFVGVLCSHCEGRHTEGK